MNYHSTAIRRDLTVKIQIPPGCSEMHWERPYQGIDMEPEELVARLGVADKVEIRPYDDPPPGDDGPPGHPSLIAQEFSYLHLQ